MTDQQDLRGLAQKWRADRSPDSHTDAWTLGYLRAKKECADELKTALREAAAQLGRAHEPNGKLVGWWNGIYPDVTGRSLQEPSIRWGADGENSRHDIPLYDGYNPIHYQNPTAAQLPAGAPEYDRELIAGMLDDLCSKVPNSDTKYSHWSIQEMARLLRAADNRDAEGVHTAKREVGVPDATGYYLASFKHKANGLILWWGPDDCGYTPDLEQAGIYTEIKPGYHDSEHTVPVPVSFLKSLRVRRIVDPGDSLNTMFWSAEKLRAAIAAAPQPDNKESR